MDYAALGLGHTAGLVSWRLESSGSYFWAGDSHWYSGCAVRTTRVAVAGVGPKLFYARGEKHGTRCHRTAAQVKKRCATALDKLRARPGWFASERQRRNA